MRKSTSPIQLAIAVLAIAFTSCSQAGLPFLPESLTADRIASRIRSLPRYAHFGLSGLAFFKGKLYASSNIGLLVINGASPEALYTWVAKDDVVEGPWLDLANDAVWIQHAHDNSLHRFDGSAWHRMEFPVPPAGYSRGDVQTGFVGITVPKTFWFVGGGHVWRFQGNSWVSEPQPPAPKYSAVRAIANLHNSVFYIVREGIETPSPYAVYERENNWVRQDFSEPMDFGGIVTTPDAIYVRSRDGRVFSIRSDSIEVLDTPGQCEAITQTSTGRLLASFLDKGIFLFGSVEWHLQLRYPYGKEEGEHWAHLAEWNGLIAYATTSVPHIQANDRFIYSGSDAVWVQKGDHLQRVSFD